MQFANYFRYSIENRSIRSSQPINVDLSHLALANQFIDYEYESRQKMANQVGLMTTTPLRSRSRTFNAKSGIVQGTQYRPDLAVFVLKMHDTETDGPHSIADRDFWVMVYCNYH